MTLEDLVFNADVERIEGVIPVIDDFEDYENLLSLREQNEYRWHRRYIIVHWKDGSKTTMLQDKDRKGEWRYPEDRSYSDVVRD